MQQRDFLLLFGLVLIAGGLAGAVVLIWWSRASRGRQSASGQSSPEQLRSGVGPPPGEAGPVMSSAAAPSTTAAPASVPVAVSPSSPPGNAVTTILPSREEGTWSSPGYRSARTRARWAQVLVGIAAAIFVALAATGISELSLIDRIIGGSATESEVVSFLRFAESLGSLLVLVYVTSGIAVFAWLSRTVEIVPPLGGGTPRRSPREAIGWWFFPIANFFIPYQIVRDVYRRLETTTRHGGDGSILGWWLLFMIGNLVSGGSRGIAINGTTTIDTLRSIVVIGIAASAASAVGGFLFVRIIGEIESRATERAVSLGLRGPDAVWPAQIEASPTPASVTTPVSFAPPAAPAPGADVVGASAPAGPIAYCLRCGRHRVAGTRFCGGCGTDLGAAPE